MNVNEVMHTGDVLNAAQNKKKTQSHSAYAVSCTHTIAVTNHVVADPRMSTFFFFLTSPKCHS